MTSWDASDFEGVVNRFMDHLVTNKGRAAMAAAEVIKVLAQSKTPVESGNLRGSADVRPDGGGFQVFYPGPYARYQHYGLDFRHETGQALYLEMALLEGTERAMAAAAAVLRP